jgi:hypothetical protein
LGQTKVGASEYLQPIGTRAMGTGVQRKRNRMMMVILESPLFDEAPESTVPRLEHFPL